MKRLVCLVSLCLVGGMLWAVPAAAQWTNGQDAEYVIGQADWTSTSSATTQNGLKYPAAAAIDIANGKLYIADRGNNRILRFSYPITGNHPNAELVYGQADFTSGSVNAGGSVSASTLNTPQSLAVDSTGRLWVCDSENNRVVWYDAAYSDASNQPDADGVLGQADFVSDSVNRGGSAAASTMNYPYGLAMDTSGALFVADSGNHRVLRFDSAVSKPNGASADGVLGQSTFTASGNATAATRMDNPYALALHNGSLYVTDRANNRVLRFDSATSKANGASADGVLGQSSFTTSGSGTTATGMYQPAGVACDGRGRLYVGEFFNKRVLLFDAAASKANGAAADNVIGQVDFTTTTGGTTQATMQTVSGVTVDSTNGKLLACGYWGNRVCVFAATSSLDNIVPVIAQGAGPLSVSMSEDGSPTPWSAPTLSATDADSDTLTWSVSSAASHGTATVSGTGASPTTFSYAPTADWSGSDSFVVQVSDGFGGTDTITVNVTVNDAPVITQGAGPLSVSMSEDGTPIAWSAPTLGATDQESDTLTWSVSGTASHGTATVSGTGASPTTFTYTPDANYAGLDSFMVQVSDGNGGTDTITVDVTINAVNDAPVIDQGAGPLSLTMSEDGSPTAWSAPTVSATDPDTGDTLTWSTGTASHGTATVSGTGASPTTFTYTPDANYAGLDSFVVQVSDGNGGTATITVNVTINAVNDAPAIDQGTGPLSVTMSEDGSPTAWSAPTLSATDPDTGDTLTWSTGTASHGTATVSGTGASPTIFTYAPTADYSGTDSFVVQVSDGNGGTDTITVNVTVTPVADEPVVTVWPEASMVEGNTLATAQWTRTGAAEFDGTPVPGEFTFTDPTVTPPLGEYTASAVFTPEDSANYLPVNGNITVKVYTSQDAVPLAFVEGPIVNPLGDTTAVVSWETNRPATAVLDYAPASGKAQAVVSQLGTMHSVELTGLTAATEYSLTVTATGLEAETAASHAVTFLTLPAADTTGPQLISGPFVLDVTDTNIVLALRTDEDASVTLEVYTGGALAGTVTASTTAQADAIIALEGLAPETAYSFVITLEDAFGNPTVWNDMAGTLLPVTTLASPDTNAPVIVEGPIVETVGANHIILRWQTDEPASSTVNYGSGGTMDLMSGEDGFSTEHCVYLTNLEPVTAYTLQASSTDVAGNGPTTSQEIVVTTLSVDEADTEAPVFVVAPAIISQSDTTATIYWETDEPADTVVEYGTAEPFTGRVSIARKTLHHEVTLTGLTPGTVYYYRCSSTDTATPGNTAYGYAVKQGGLSNFTTDTAPDLTAPTLVEGPELIVLNSDFVSLRFVTDEVANSSVTFWPDGDAGSARTVASLGHTMEHIAAFTGLAPETTYCYIVTVVDPSGNSNATAQMSFTTPAASAADTAAPTFTAGPEASAIGETRSTISWATDTFTSGEVWCGTEQAVFSKVSSTAGLGETHEVLLTGLEPCTEYYVQVVAVNQKEAATAGDGFWIKTEGCEQGGDCEFGFIQLFLMKILAILAAIFGFELHIKETP